MTQAELKALIEEAHELATSLLAGCEYASHYTDLSGPELFDLIDRARKLGMAVRSIPDTASTSLVLGGNGSYSASGEAAADAATEGWRDIESAPRDGTHVLGFHDGAARVGVSPYRRTWWGKTSHVPIYGWCFGEDVENIQLWKPSHWKPLSNGALPRHGKPLSDATDPSGAREP